MLSRLFTRKPRKATSLPWRLKLAYGVGHVLNDLCAAVWFTYLLVFFKYVLRFDNSLAGVILLIGQVADGLATPFVGIESDRKTDFWMCRYGQRKTWHLIGTVCVLGSFPFIFMPCIHCGNSAQWAQVIYYAAFVIVFQFGWAAVQISHLSLITDLTPSENVRTELTAIRYAFTVLSTITVYMITWLVLGVDDSGGSMVGPDDVDKFRDVVLIALGIGLVFSVIFHVGVPERKLCRLREEAKAKLCCAQQSLSTNSTSSSSLSVEDSPPSYTSTPVAEGDKELVWTVDTPTPPPEPKCMKIKDWLKLPHFYKVAVVYMGTRLFVNMSQVFLPLYIQGSLGLPKQNIAVLPLVTYVAGFVASIGVKPLNKVAGRRIAYTAGSAVCIAGCVAVAFGQGDFYRFYGIYGSTILLGAGASTVLVTSLGITADLIGSNTECGAFVYGAMSLTDKMSNGIVVMLIQDLYPCSVDNAAPCTDYYRWNLAAACGASVVMALLGLATFRRKPAATSNVTLKAGSLEPVVAGSAGKDNKGFDCPA